MLIRGATGCVADVEISGATAIDEPQFHISGSRGSLLIQGETCRLKYLQDEHAQAMRATADTPDQQQRPRSTESLEWVDHTEPLPPAHSGQFWIEVYRHLRHGVPLPLTLQEARETMRVIELARPAAALPFHATGPKKVPPARG